MAKTIGADPVGFTRGFTRRASVQPSGVCRATTTGRSTSIESRTMRVLRSVSTRYVTRDAVDRDDRRAGLFEAHAVEDDAGEQVAADARDRDLRVEQPLGADDDVAAQPVAEPARLRHAEQAEHDSDDQDGREIDETAQPAAPAARRPLPFRLERCGRRVAQAHRSIILQPGTKCTAKTPARR